MKKLFGTVMVLALTAGLAGQVQAQDQMNMYFGFVGGGTYFKTFGSDAPANGTYEFGFQGGAFFQVAVNPNFAVDLGANYVQKNSGVEGSTEKLKLAYLEVPLRVNVVFPFADEWYGSVFTGASLGFALSCKEASVDCKDDLKSTDFGVPVGAGIGYKLQSGVYVALEGQYSYGLVDIPEQDGVAVKNRGWSASLRVGIPIRR
jgi:opacity protein-like surface antigen